MHSPEPAPAGQAWQQALDPELVDRLWQRVERPGIVHLRLTEAVLRRYRGMTAGVPLAELLLRRWEAGLEAPTAPLALVYARPSAFPVAGDAAPGARRPQPTGPEAASTPVVPARLAQPDQQPPSLPGLPLQAGLPLRARPEAAPTLGGGPLTTVPGPPTVAPRGDQGPVLPPVQQRSARPVVTAARTAASPSTAPELPSGPARRTFGAADNAPTPTRLAQAPPARGAVVVAGTASASDSSPASSSRRPDRHRHSPGPAGPALVVPGSSFVGDAGAPRGAPLGNAPAMPTVPAGPRHPRNRPAVVPGWEHPLPASDRAGTPAVPVVHELIIRDRVARTYLPAAHPPATLPLATAAEARPPVEPVQSVQPGAATGGTTRRPSVPAARGAVHMRPSRAESSGRAAEAVGPVPAPIDIDRIVDKVHRRLMHRLAIEGERRGMTR
jgi:hypothetical protein